MSSTKRYHLETRTNDRAWKSQGSWGTERTARQHFASTVANSGHGLTIRIAEYDRFEDQPTVNPTAVLAIITTTEDAE